jgi:hypothetical protein
MNSVESVTYQPKATTSTMKTTASLLPMIPRIFFLYLEPPIILYGMTMTYAHRLPLLSLFAASSSSSSSSPNDVGVGVGVLSAPGLSATYLLSMLLYGLLVLLSSPPNPRLLKCHIALLAVADITHWYVITSTLSEMQQQHGHDGSAWYNHVHPSHWYHDEQTRLLMLAPLATFLFKLATLAGLFGRIGDA